MSRYNLEEKIALITGSARGIGVGIARRLAAEGCLLVMNDVDADRLTSSVKKLSEKHGKIVEIAGDVGKEEDVERMFEIISERFKGLDILVNNAALVGARKWLQDVPNDYFDEVMRINVRGMYLCSRAAAALMDRRGGGSIINLSSVGAARSFRAHVPYITSKGAVESLTRALAVDLASYGIRVNAIGPGMIATEAWQAFSAEKIKRLRQIPLLKREGNPEDIAGVVAFLASEDAGFVTGQIIYVDGGQLCQFYSPCAEIPHLINLPPERYEPK